MSYGCEDTLHENENDKRAGERQAMTVFFFQQAALIPLESM